MTTATMTSLRPHEAPKRKGMMRKMIRYLQNQAVENSNPRSYLTPPGLEPHQKVRPSHHTRPSHEDDDCNWAQRHLSDATTVTEQYRQPGRSASYGADPATSSSSRTSSAEEMKKVQYAQENILQNYRVYIPERDVHAVRGKQYWIVYIHGGYFRDPKIDATTFIPALNVLTGRESESRRSSTFATRSELTASAAPVSGEVSDEFGLIHERISGYASVNYRLSPHPAYPQDDDTEQYVRREAEFPDQLHDIHAAIRHLQTKYGFTNNYILAGHSVGATLAFLAALKAADGQIDVPACIVGLNGIYDFSHLHGLHPDYEFLTKNAMRPDQYHTASPAQYPSSDYLNIVPGQPFRVLLSHSKNDGLVDWDQIEIMQRVFHSDESGSRLHVRMIETHGSHDTTWKHGRELARTLTEAVQMVTVDH